MSKEEEKSIGAREDPKIVKQFGGIYKNENLQKSLHKSHPNTKFV